MSDYLKPVIVESPDHCHIVRKKLIQQFERLYEQAYQYERPFFGGAMARDHEQARTLALCCYIDTTMLDKYYDLCTATYLRPGLG